MHGDDVVERDNNKRTLLDFMNSWIVELCGWSINELFPTVAFELVRKLKYGVVKIF